MIHTRLDKFITNEYKGQMITENNVSISLIIKDNTATIRAFDFATNGEIVELKCKAKEIDRFIKTIEDKILKERM